VDELPSESGPAGADTKELSLEEQISLMTDLDVEGEQGDQQPKPPDQPKK